MRTASLLFSLLVLLVHDRYHQQVEKYRWQIPGGRLGIEASDRSYRTFPFVMLE
jgi:hypothetical protein